MQKRTENALTVVSFDSWDEFSESVQKSSSTLFRGQRDPKWRLQSHWERDVACIAQHLLPGAPIQSIFHPGAYEANRDRYLHHFRSMASKIPGFDPIGIKSDDAWWALGRNYGLLSPLLDWTLNPFVAAFFAYTDLIGYIFAGDPTEEQKKSRVEANPFVAVWCLRDNTTFFRKGEFELVKASTGFAARQEAQEGVFTRLMTGEHFDIASYLASLGKVDALSRFDLPSKHVGKVVAHLHEQGTHYATLFPDFWGAAMYANMRRMVKPECLAEILDSTTAT